MKHDDFIIKDAASARDGAAAEAARIARDMMAAREPGGLHGRGGGASPGGTADMSRKDRKASQTAQKAAINMGMREWLGAF